MQLLGLTGNIACGKSTIAGWLQEWGAEVLDADQLVHELYSSPRFAAQVAQLFGDCVLNSAGEIDRGELGALVFNDATALKQLEDVVHPAVAALRAEKLRELAGREEPPSLVVLEAVKLLESDQARGCSVVWCVSCSPEAQLRRLQEKRGLDEEAARARLASQPPLEKKEALAREQNVPLVFLSTDTTLEELEACVQVLWKELLSSA